MNDRKQWDQYVSFTQEDECLVEVISDLGTSDWSAVSNVLVTKFGIKVRSGKKCRERWINHLNPEVSKSVWGEDEEKILFRCHGFYGNQWTEIAKFLPGRTDNSVKNYFYSTLRRKIRWYNKLRPAHEKITISANEVSLIPILTKQVLETPDRKKQAAVSLTYILYRRKSNRLQRTITQEAFELPKVVCIESEIENLLTMTTEQKDQISFDFSRYSGSSMSAFGVFNI